jgi:hypothetical protein
VLKKELGFMYVSVSGFFDAFFGEIADLGPAAQAVFDKCKGGDIRSTIRRVAGKVGLKGQGRWMFKLVCTAYRAALGLRRRALAGP